MGPKMLAETADMIGVKELRDAFREVRMYMLVIFHHPGEKQNKTNLGPMQRRDLNLHSNQIHSVLSQYTIYFNGIFLSCHS